MNAKELAGKVVSGDLNENQVNYWLKINDISEEEFKTELDSLLEMGPNSSLLLTCLVVGGVIWILICLFN